MSALGAHIFHVHKEILGFPLYSNELLLGLGLLLHLHGTKELLRTTNGIMRKISTVVLPAALIGNSLRKLIREVKRGLVEHLGRLANSAALLLQRQDDAPLVVDSHINNLLVGQARVFVRVLVQNIAWLGREADTVALNKERVPGANDHPSEIGRHC